MPDGNRKTALSAARGTPNGRAAGGRGAGTGRAGGREPGGGARAGGTRAGGGRTGLPASGGYGDRSGGPAGARGTGYAGDVAPGRAAVPAVRARAGTPPPVALDIGVPRPGLTGARLKVAGRKRSGPRQRGTAVVGLRTAAGTGRLHGVAAQLLRGATVRQVAERPKRKMPPTQDPSRARWAVQPRLVATSGRGRLGRRGQSRPAAPGESSPVGGGELPGLRVLRDRPRVAGRPPQAATSGSCPLGEVPAAPASPSAVEVVCPNPPAGVGLPTFGAS